MRTPSKLSNWFLSPCLSIVVLFYLLGTGWVASAQSKNVLPQTSEAQLNDLIPEEQDLSGFSATSPAGELGQSEVFEEGHWTHQDQPASAIKDETQLNVDPSRNVIPWAGRYSTLRRRMFSANGLYRIDMMVWLCDRPATAQYVLDEYHRNSDAFYSPGALTGKAMLGDASWACTEYLPDKSLLYRSGNIAVLVNGGPSRTATKQGLQSVIPDTAIEAIAYQILFRASQQPDLTGVMVQASSVAVNGHALPKGALKVAGRVYVPVQAFARAMRLTSGWDAKTGALTLSGPRRKTVALTAGSTQATVGGAKVASLAVPVLKDGGEPVMALSDLLRLTGGRVTGRVGNTVQVKG